MLYNKKKYNKRKFFFQKFIYFFYSHDQFFQKLFFHSSLYRTHLYFLFYPLSLCRISFLSIWVSFFTWISTQYTRSLFVGNKNVFYTPHPFLYFSRREIKGQNYHFVPFEKNISKKLYSTPTNRKNLYSCMDRKMIFCSTYDFLAHRTYI